MKPHKHKDLIIAWANGALIEVWNTNLEKWLLCSEHTVWEESRKFRIKPEPKPDIVMYGGVDSDGYFIPGAAFGGVNQHSQNNLKLTFDGDTGELKEAEVLE